MSKKKKKMSVTLPTNNAYYYVRINECMGSASGAPNHSIKTFSSIHFLIFNINLFNSLTITLPSRFLFCKE